MKLIIGLGNPGAKYQNNRHNVGYMLIDQLPKNKNLIAKKTNVFMNDSGPAVQKFLRNSQLEVSKLFIVHDDLDLPLGAYKIHFGRGPKDHRGVNSLYDALGTHDFWHVRIGVDNRNPESRTPGEEYVLEDFLPEEKVIIDKVIAQVCKKLATS